MIHLFSRFFPDLGGLFLLLDFLRNGFLKRKRRNVRQALKGPIWDYMVVSIISACFWKENLLTVELGTLKKYFVLDFVEIRLVKYELWTNKSAKIGWEKLRSGLFDKQVEAPPNKL